MQLTGCDYGNDMRNAICVTRNALTCLLFILYTVTQGSIDKNRIHFMNAYYKEAEKPFGYLLVDNKPSIPTDKQILGDLFGECYVYHFGVKSPVVTKPVGKLSTTPVTKTKPARKKSMQTITWSDVPIDEWVKYISGAPAVHKIPEGHVIIEMYNTSRNENHQPPRGGVLINDENYWPVKLKHRSLGHIKWVNLHSDDSTVPSNPLSKKLWKTLQKQS